MENTELLFNKKYPLSKEDFKPVEMHYIIFCSIASLANKGAGKISVTEIDNFVKAYPAKYEILQDSDWMGFVSTVTELSTKENYELYYNATRKFSLLRKLKDMGYDIKEFYDEMLDEESQDAKLNKYSVQDILNSIDSDVGNLRKEFDTVSIRDNMWIGEDFSDVLNSFKQTPVFGKCYQSPYLSTIFLGCQRGHLTCQSRLSGTGKTSGYISDMCYMNAKEIYMPEYGDFVPNPNYDDSGMFFLFTEMELHTEIQPKFISFVANVPYNKMRKGKLTAEEEKRALKAAEIMVDSRVQAYSCPDFTIGSIKQMIKQCTIGEGLQYGVFDYIQSTPTMLADYKSRAGVASREDMALLSLATELKNCSEEFDCSILTGTQLNPDKVASATRVSEELLSGARAIKNKIDNGYIVLKPTAKELKLISGYLMAKGIKNNNEPNNVIHVYKSRFNGEYEGYKIFQYVDYQTGRSTDILVTDPNYKRVSMEKSVLEWGF